MPQLVRQMDFFEERLRMLRKVAMGLLMIGAMACGGASSESTPAETAGETGPVPAHPNEMAAAAAQQAVQNGLAQMGQQQAKVVDYTVLKGMIPEFSGWTRSEPKGETVQMGVAISNAKAEYTKGDSSIDLEITDTAFMQALTMPFAMIASYSQRSDDGFKQGATIAGNPGWEEWRKDGGYGEMNLLVGNRFVVSAKGNNLPSTEPVKQLVQAVDLAKLGTLK